MPALPICRLCGIMFAGPEGLNAHLRSRHQILPDEHATVGEAAGDRARGTEAETLAEHQEEGSDLALQR